MIESGKTNLLQIMGFIIPTEFNRHGRPVEIGIETESFERYIVGNGGRVKELFEYLFHEVVVSGLVVGESTEGTPIVKIKKYEIKDQINLIDRHT